MHHAASRNATASSSEDTYIQEERERDRLYTYVHAIHMYVRDYGYHVDDWIKCISHARNEPTYAAHMLVHVNEIFSDTRERERGRENQSRVSSIRDVSIRAVQTTVRLLFCKEVYACMFCTSNWCLEVCLARKEK